MTEDEDVRLELESQPDDDDDPSGVHQVEEGGSVLMSDTPEAPLGVQEFGVTADEQRRGESLGRRLDEEEPEGGDVTRRRSDDTGERDAEDAAMHVVESIDDLPGATDDPVDHYLEDD